MDEIVNSKFPKVLEIVRAQPGGNSDESIFNLQPLVERAKRTVMLISLLEAFTKDLEVVKTDRRPAFMLN